MSILSELQEIFDSIGLKAETGYFSGKAPDEYIVVTPLSDNFELYTDNLPEAETQEVRLSLFSKHNYTQRKNQLVRLLLQADFSITERKYIGFEPDTKYHHYAIDCNKYYETEQ